MQRQIRKVRTNANATPHRAGALDSNSALDLAGRHDRDDTGAL